MEPHVTKLDFSIDPERLHTELDNLLSDVGFSNPNQLTLTSVLGNNNWEESTGKIKNLKFPEKAYCELNARLHDTIFDEIISHFPGYTRWRLLKLSSHSNYSIHSDSDNGKKNIRVHIPVITNPDAYLMFFNERTEPKMHHLEVGNAYQVNTTGLHSAINFGWQDRYHIVGVKYEG
jgi:hypothetical protein|tara:strand:- start:198 stop:725 length:528 start_codon:yes stop_codon:yes gene_type:complete